MAAYSQFSYQYGASASQLLMPGQPSAPSTPGTPSTSCCETGRPVATDPVTGQAICSCQYEAGGGGRSGALCGYPRLPAGTALPYGPAYSSGGDQGAYPGIGVDSSYFAF
ncbi:homeobox protein araucan-like, partial [Amphibalanus amphitrite]